MAQTPSVDFTALLAAARNKRAVVQVAPKSSGAAKAKRNSVPAPKSVQPAKVMPIVRKQNYVPPALPRFTGGISATEFIQGTNRTTDQMKIRELIVQYMGSYDLLEPFGVQFDNARIRAREEYRSSIMPDSNAARIPRMPNPPGRVAEALRLGRDAQRRLAMLLAEENSAPSEAIKSALESQLEQATTVLTAYMQSEGLN